MDFTNIIVGNKYKIIKQIGSGSFGDIFEGVNMRTSEKVAIKMEAISNQLKLLKHESNIYRILSNVDGIPKIKWYGKDDVYYYMVIDLFGKSLQDLLDKTKKMSLKLVLQIGINILTILMKIHDSGFIHRDIKPENFLLTLNNPTKVFLIDFGISKPYIINNKHIVCKMTHQFIGTPNFASINTHNFYEQSRRDDLEALAYMLIYFYFGELEWTDTKISFLDKEEENNFVKNKKKELINNENVPGVLMDYYKNVVNLEFDENPDYKQLINNFTNELLKNNE